MEWENWELMTSSSGDSSSLPLLDWKFSQVFGEKIPGEDVQDVDVVSALEFDKSGDYLAVGDKGGRVVIFERNDGKDTSNQHNSRNELERLDFTFSRHPVYQYKTEFQSHEPEFDYLKSLEIEEKINRVKWCATPNGSLFILSTNDKTIKLWKVKECKDKKVKEMEPSSVSSESSLLAERSFVSEQSKMSNGYHAERTKNKIKNNSPFQEAHTKIAYAEDTTRASCRKVYAHAHDFNINSISNNSDGETFISADDLRINLWNLEISDQCFNIIDMKPSNMEDLTEVITSAEFHPLHCNMLAYSSSRGFIHLVDMRQSALCDQSARIIQDAEFRGSKSFFTEIIASISDIKFTNDGQHLLSRDYMNLKLWDIRMDTSPVSVFKIHEHLRPKLCDLYNNDSIFDKFECCISGDGLHFATGSYSNLLRIFSYGVGNEEGVTVEANKHPNRKPLPRSATKARRSSLSNLTRGFYWHGNDNSSSVGNEFSCDLSSKLLHLAWHPTATMIACSSGNSLYMYYA
ncbi:serine/threonine protein phosphatase 2A 55 kDa regulatory subunit B beta isoform-like [Mercurialis annua]|uniref:serine/threonine protein phosphatase 2A 55 kDa regulatory subunit B beta isoform-like n=1 Tax=Mercurialis annua TaxID=3986 RepID=UPI002160ECF6|nr:serine/threonine protein phosphatase 2A 55 kDa regulatory subunit B beta isoform-like [Mercurialis annua]